MKKRLVLTVALAALLTLAGCGPTSTNTGDSNSATSSQSVDYTAIAITNKTALTAAWKAGEANRKVSLSITPAANDTALLASGELVVASSDTTVISVVGEYLTPVKAGKATITVTLGKVSDSVEITVAEAPKPVAISTLTGKETLALVAGVITGVGTKGYMVDDGTGAVYVYGSLPSGIAKGNYVQISASASIYYGIVELSAKTVTKLTTTAPTLPAAVELTSAQVDTWAAATWSGTAVTLTTADTKLLKFTGEAKKVGSYVELFLAGNDKAIGGLGLPTTMSWTEGKFYDVTGYSCGWNGSSSFLQILVVSSVEHIYAPESLTVSAAGDATSVAVGGTLQLSATVLPAGAPQDVVWSMDDADKTYASISETGLVTALAEKAAGVVFTATSKTVATVKNTLSIVIDPKPADPVTSVTLDQTSLAMVVTDTATLVATVLPATSLQTVTWTSEDATVASVAAGVVTANKVGTTNIVATSDGDDSTGAKVVAKCAVTVTALPAAVSTTIAKLKAITAKDGVLYEVSGIVEANSFATAKSGKYYNNAYLTDPATGDCIQIYGSSENQTALTYSAKTVTFTNPATAAITDIANGDLVTMLVLAVPYTNTTTSAVTPEITGVYTAHATATTTYKATINTPENGTASLSKAEGIAYGSVVTVTVAPAAGYEVASVKVTNAKGDSIDATVVTKDSSYSFTATCVNSVVVTFAAKVVQSGSAITLTPASLLGYASTNIGYNTTASSKKLDGLEFGYLNVACYGTGLQFKNGAGYLQTNADSLYYITSIVVTNNTTKNVVGKLPLVAATSVAGLSTATAATAATSGMVETYTFTETQKIVAFKLGTPSAASYVDSIVITFGNKVA